MPDWTFGRVNLYPIVDIAGEVVGVELEGSTDALLQVAKYLDSKNALRPCGPRKPRSGLDPLTVTHCTWCSVELIPEEIRLQRVFCVECYKKVVN